MRAKASWLCAAAVVVASTACNGPQCIVGASASCACTSGAMGAQVCLPGGTFGECVCIGPDAGRDPDAGTSDAGMRDAGRDAGVDCNPFADPGAQGCAAGEKCTWIVLSDTTGAGTLACVPDGSVEAGGGCAWGPAGSSGFDDCRAGLVCISGSCADVCGFDGSSGASCAAGSSCARYDGLFAIGADEPNAGACAPACNPIVQTRTSDGMPCGGGMGCYLLSGATDTIAVCARAGDIGHNVDILGAALANSCVPGAQPRNRDSIGLVLQCGGLCNASDVTSSGGAAAEGGLDILGNPTAKDNCQTAWGAAPPGDGVGGESCRYWWAREAFAAPSPFGNTVGWCFKHAVHQYDTNLDGTNDAPFPRCSTLTTGDIVPPIGLPMHSDAEYFWCTAESGDPTIPRATMEPHLDRLGGWR